MERNADERPVAAGGGGHSARPLLAVDRHGFVERHGLDEAAQQREYFSLL